MFMQNNDRNNYKKINGRYDIKLNNIIKTLLIVCLIFTLLYLFIYIFAVLMQNLLLEIYFSSRSNDNKVFIIPLIQTENFIVIFISILFSIIFLNDNISNSQITVFETISIIIVSLFLINITSVTSYIETWLHSKLKDQYYYNYIAIKRLIDNFDWMVRAGAISLIFAQVIIFIKKMIFLEIYHQQGRTRIINPLSIIKQSCCPDRTPGRKPP